MHWCVPTSIFPLVEAWLLARLWELLFCGYSTAPPILLFDQDVAPFSGYLLHQGSTVRRSVGHGI